MAIQAPTEDDLKRKTLDDGVSSYLDKTAENLGKPSYMTEAGSLYADRVTNGLKTPDASSVNAQQTEDTNAARRAYLAKTDADERLGQSGFALGSAQATRIADQSQAGVNQANQAGQSAVNAYIRQRTEDNLSRARGLELDQQQQNQVNLQNVQGQSNTLYNRGQDTLDRTERADETTYRRGRDAVGDTRYADETMYNRTQDALNRGERADQTKYSRTQDAQARIDNLDQRSWEREQVLKGNDETAKRNLLNELPDGPAKNAILQGLADGSLTTATALAKVMNPDGSIKEEYRGKTPAQLGNEAVREQAILALQTEAAAKGTSFDPDSPAGVMAVAGKMLEMQKAKDAPITKENEAAYNASIKAKLDTGEPLTDEEKTAAIKSGAIPPLSMSTIPAGAKNVDAFLKEYPSGQFAIDGKVYTLVNGSDPRTGRSKYTNSPRHTGVAEIKDPEGNIKYYYKGEIHDSPPETVGDVQITPFGW